MARKLVPLVVDIHPRHRVFLDRKKRELQACEELKDKPEKVTDDAVVQQLIDYWMSVERVDKKKGV